MGFLFFVWRLQMLLYLLINLNICFQFQYLSIHPLNFVLKIPNLLLFPQYFPIFIKNINFKQWYLPQQTPHPNLIINKFEISLQRHLFHLHITRLCSMIYLQYIWWLLWLLLILFQLGLFILLSALCLSILYLTPACFLLCFLGDRLSTACWCCLADCLADFVVIVGCLGCLGCGFFGGYTWSMRYFL